MKTPDKWGSHAMSQLPPIVISSINDGGPMSDSGTSKRDPNWFGRNRLWVKFNANHGGFTNAFRISDFDRMLAGFPLVEGVNLEGWFQNGGNLTALYQLGSTLVLLERYVLDETTLYVACVGGQSWKDVSTVVTRLVETQRSLEELWNDVSGDRRG